MASAVFDRHIASLLGTVTLLVQVVGLYTVFRIKPMRGVVVV